MLKVLKEQSIFALTSKGLCIKKLIIHKSNQDYRN